VSTWTSSFPLPPSLALPHVHTDVSCIRADQAPSPLPSLLTRSLPPAPLPSLASVQTLENFIFYFLSFIFGSYCPLEKRGKKCSVFGPQDPQDPQDPQALRASRAKPREEGFFGLIPLVTHPSSIPLLGGLTPKFLSLSLHSL
jgi:hypothetical protein